MSKSLPTVAVDRGGHKAIINESDYKPDVDVLWSEPNESQTKELQPNNEAQGESKTQEAEVTPTQGDSPLLPIEDRLAELQGLAADKDWRALKAIAEGHGISRPDDGWDASVLPILVAEYGQAAAEEVYTQPTEE